jgi:putative nucleotidyltransferase with HDIG domain
VWLTVWRLREFRQRDTLIRAGALTGLALVATSLLLSGVLHPLSSEAFPQTLRDACFSGLGALMVGFVVLGMLPTIERVFGVTTGMSLIELRDPKNPLLRLLQQRAPGTYNHSLNVASLAESAADAIGADGLLTYVGALYHDVGKLNKPEFFVENQTAGINRHERLTPAMSLLVIVGHVKEGIELAREHALPRCLWHFIEAHHGTTLVEYFYHRARKAAEGHTSGVDATHVMPQEIEYRYPGPKPRTREAAIVMICDASESATRAMTDPSPTRIDSLVRAIAHKRLMDGQFDDSELTLRDLHTIIETVARSLASIHHGRIAYPEAAPARAAARTGPAPSLTDGPATQPALTGVGSVVRTLASPGERRAV